MMKSLPLNAELLFLVSETLKHIKENHRIAKPEHTPPKTPAPKKKQDPLIFDKIHKHLPQIQLTQKIPEITQVAIVAFHLEDVPFLKNLAKAIQDNFCPVKLLDGNKISHPEGWEDYLLVLTQKKLTTPKAILLETIATYQNNPKEKKRLWSMVCQHLSPKSS